MARLRNVQTGAVISCSDEKAARLGREWQPVEIRAEAGPEIQVRKPARRARKRT